MASPHFNLFIKEEDIRSSPKRKEESRDKSSKKKNKEKSDESFDHGWDDFDVDVVDEVRSLTKPIAHSLECFKDFMETYTIFEGCTEEEWEVYMKKLDKLITKLKEEDASVFNREVVTDMIRNGHPLAMEIRR